MKTYCEHLKPGDILDQDIVMPTGRVLMTAGMSITPSMIELLKKRGFESVLIKSSKYEVDPIINIIFNSENLVNQTMIDFKQYVIGRDDYFDLIKQTGEK